MKWKIWLLPLVLYACSLTAQTTATGYVILNPRSVPNISDFIHALENNDLERFRQADQRTTIRFEEGLNIELLSAREMLEAGLQVDMSKINTTAKDRTQHSRFSLHPSGRIIISAIPIKKGL